MADPYVKNSKTHRKNSTEALESTVKTKWIPMEMLI